MTILARAGAFWAASKWLLILGGLLAASVTLNVKQYADCRVKLAVAPLKDENRALEQAQEVSAGLLSDAHARAQVLDEAASRAADRLGQAGRDYRAARAARPLTDPRCAPGPARVDATNRALGAQPPE